MQGDSSFVGLMRRVRQGDANAAAELIGQYEAELRIIARVRLNDPRLRRVVDSMDICQSILGNFFMRVTAGQFDLETLEQLLKLLATMVRNKVTDRARQQRAGRRDIRRTNGPAVDELEVAGKQESPSQIVMARELAQACEERFTSDEQQLIELRRQGQAWDEIAVSMGAKPDAVRKKVTRAIERVARELGLEEVDDA